MCVRHPAYNRLFVSNLPSSGADLTGNFQRNFENLISGNNSRPQGCNAGFISDMNARSFHEERYKARHLIENL
jgi:hypothetical protein